MLNPGQRIAQFEVGSLRNLVYLILDWEASCAAIVDPQADLGLLARAEDLHGFRLTSVLLTHTHHDHVAGLPELVKRSPELPIHVHAFDRHRLKDLEKAGARVVPIEDGAEIEVGSISVRAMHTPGHSAGEVCYFLGGEPPALLSGDTLFIRDCGRTDLPTGSDSQMFASLQKIKKLPPSTVIYPGHHYVPELQSTLERELLESRPLRARSVEELAALP